MRDLFHVPFGIPYARLFRRLLIPGGMVVGALVGFLAGRRSNSPKPATEEKSLEELALEGGEFGVWDWFPQTGLVHYNARWAELLGYTLEEVGSNINFFIRRLHPDERPTVMDHLTAYVEGRSPVYRSEHRMRTKSGEWKWFLDRGRVVERDREGHVVRVSGFVVDISSRKGVVEALEKRRLALARPGGGTAGLRFEDLFDLDEIQRIQDAFSTATGVASMITDTHGRPITKPSNFCDLCKIIRRTSKGRQNCYRSDAMLGRKHSGGPIIAPCLSGGLFDGGASICAGDEHIANWLIGQVRDESISDEELMKYARKIGADEAQYREALAQVPHMTLKRFKRVCEVLYLIAGQLSKLALRNVQQGRVIYQLEQAQAELREAKEVAEAASRAKDQFLGVLSHELRTPLTAVLATVANLRDDFHLTAESREDMELIQRNVALEARLIDDLLDVTRISKGKLEMNESVVDAHACIRNALEICEGDAEAKQQALSLRLEAGHHHVMADPARLQQVFWNLFKNAIKFTPEAGRIDVRTFNDQGRIRVEVSDTGIGIEPADIPRIFQAFEQLGQNRSFGGLGLGLSIAKAVVEHYNGTLTCFSRGKNRGSTFTVDLGWVPAPEAVSAAAPLTPPPPEKEGIRVLLVEDHHDTLQILARMLGKWGYAVTPADSFQAALEQGRNGTFDVLVSDLGLPDGNGLDLMRQLRIPGIALSGYGTEKDIRESLAAGFDEHLVKPVGLEALRKALQKVAGRLSQPVV